MKQIVVLFYLLLVTPFIVAQTANADPVIMNIDGKEVLKSEFDYFLNKNNTSETPLTKKEIKEYADLFLNFKLKVAAAERAGMDTLSTFLEEYKQYRDLQAEEFMLDSAYLETLAKQTFEASAKEVGPDGIVNLNILTIVPQGDTQEDLGIAYHKIDSIYKLLTSGANFNETAARNSQARGTGGLAQNLVCANRSR